MSDWLARKLAERQNQPPPPPFQLPPPQGWPQQQPPPGYPQQGYQQQTVAPPGYQPPPPQVPGYGQQYQQQPQVLGPMNPNDPQFAGMSAYQRTVIAVGDKGRTATCPECHKDSLYQITHGENGGVLRMLPAPVCTECGYPNVQSGSLHGNLAMAKATGPTKHARQLSSHTVNTYDDRGRIIETFEPQRAGQGGTYV